MEKIYTTSSYKQTQKLGAVFAKEIEKNPAGNTATVLGLTGNLGGGKTTFLQGFAKSLGIKEKITSPTFVIMKKFKIYPGVNSTLSRTFHDRGFDYFYHFDCYRLKNYKDILELGFKEIISNPENIVAIEWPEKIQKVLPKNIISIDFKFIDEKTREINFGTPG